MSIRGFWRRHRGVMLALLVGSAATALAWWAIPVRPRAYWTESPANLFAFTPDGRAILSGGEDGLRLRDAATGQLIWENAKLDGADGRPSGMGMTRVSLSEDGRTLVGMESRGCLKVLDMATGRERITFRDVAEGWGPLDPGSFLEEDQEDPTVTFAYLHDRGGRVLAFARHEVEDGPLRAEVWDAGSATLLARFDDAVPMAISPDGRRIALCESQNLQGLEGPRLLVAHRGS